MSDKTGIEWTDATWNPTTGCDKVSPGCDNCYAMTLAKRLKAMGSARYQVDGNPATSGPGFGFTTHPDALDQPLRWKRPRRIFVNSMSDLFHSDMSTDFLADVFAVMSMAKQHTFQVLTKRPGVMRSVLSSPMFKLQVNAARLQRGVSVLPDSRRADGTYAWPLPNVWLGTSVEDQKRADLRVPQLLATPAAVRFLSMEPLLGPVSLSRWIDDELGALDRLEDIAWVIVGGESGYDARPMHPRWVRSLRDQCTDAGVPFLFKQWGEWAPAPWGVQRHPGETDDAYKTRAEATCATAVITNPMPDGSWAVYEPDYKPWSAESGDLPAEYAGGSIRRVGKKAAGRELDGRTWDEFPEAVLA